MSARPRPNADLEPWEAQDRPLPRRVGGTHSNLDRVNKAMTLLRPVFVSLGSRRPRNCNLSTAETDALQRRVEGVLAELRGIGGVLGRGRR